MSTAGPWVAFVTCCLIWGSTFLFIRIGNDTLAPVWAAALRLAVAGIILVALALVLRRPWPRGRELRAALWFGLVDFGVSLPLLNWGERTVASSSASVFFATIPLTTALFARAFGLERLRPRQIVASLAALGGVAALSAGPWEGGAGPLPLVAVFVASVAAALSGVLLKRAPDGDPIAVNAVAHAAGAPVCLLASVVAGERPSFPAGSGAVSILFLALVGSVAVFVTFAWLLRRWPVSRTSYIAVLVPVVAMLLGRGVRGEPLGPGLLAGAALVIGAVGYGVGSSGNPVAGAPGPAPAVRRR